MKEGALNLDDINCENLPYDPWRAYMQSKICNLIFTMSLAKRLRSTNVTVNALHPGIIRSEILRYYKEAYGWSDFTFRSLRFVGWPFEHWFLKSSKQGAQTTIFCAVDEAVEGVSGKYFSDCGEREVMATVLDNDVQQRLWKMSEVFVNSSFNFN